jgi:hypothetical protein
VTAIGFAFLIFGLCLGLLSTSDCIRSKVLNGVLLDTAVVAILLGLFGLFVGIGLWLWRVMP